MFRANLMVGVVAAAILALILGVIVYALGPRPSGDAPGHGGGGSSRLGGTSDVPPDTAAPANGGTAPVRGPNGRSGVTGPAAPPPAGPVVVTGGGGSGAGSGRAPAPGPTVVVCSPNLLQTMLGLVTGLLGGGGAC